MNKPRTNVYVLAHKMTEYRRGQLLAVKALRDNELTQLEMAAELGWSKQLVNRRKRELEELEAQGIYIEDLEV